MLTYKEEALCVIAEIEKSARPLNVRGMPYMVVIGIPGRGTTIHLHNSAAVDPANAGSMKVFLDDFFSKLLSPPSHD